MRPPATAATRYSLPRPCHRRITRWPLLALFGQVTNDLTWGVSCVVYSWPAHPSTVVRCTEQHPSIAGGVSHPLSLNCLRWPLRMDGVRVACQCYCRSSPPPRCMHRHTCAQGLRQQVLVRPPSPAVHGWRCSAPTNDQCRRSGGSDGCGRLRWYTLRQLAPTGSQPHVCGASLAVWQLTGAIKL